MIKKNNRGVTLIELVVAAAILTIVIGVGMSFLVHATNVFNRGNGESNLQNEAQLTMARLQSLIVNSTHGVSTAPPQAAVPGEEGTPVEGEGTGVNLYVYNREETDVVGASGYKEIRYVITHIFQSGDQLMYATQKYNYLNGSTSLEAESTPSLLSDYISDFQVDLNDFAKKHAVKITLGFKNQTQTFSTTNTFLLRNAISDKTDGNANDYFGEDAAADKANEIGAPIIDPGEIYVWQGSSYTPIFTVKAEVNGVWTTGIPVVWSFVESGEVADVDVNRSTGTVRVGSDVDGSRLLHSRATVLSSINPGAEQKSSQVVIRVKSFTGVAMDKPKEQSETNYQVYTTRFYVMGNNLVPSTDMNAVPFVSAQSSEEAKKLSVSFERESDGTVPANVLIWKVSIRRPALYEGKNYKLVLGYKLNGKEYISSTENSMEFAFSASPAEKEQGSEEVRLVDKTTGNIYAMIENFTSIIDVNRGATKDLQLQVRYGGEGNPWLIKDSRDWSLETDNDKVSVMPDGDVYRLAVNVEDYNTTVRVNCTARYTNNKGESKEGPSIALSCDPVRFSLSGVASSHQKKFPVARGAAEMLTFEIKNLENASVCLLPDKGAKSSDSTMRVQTSGKNASVRVNDTQSASLTFYFGVRTASGTVISGLEYEVTIVPGEANVFSDDNGTPVNLFLPRATDLTNYSSQIPVPSEGGSATLYTAGGKKVVYTMRSGKYYVEYNGKKYVYDTGWRGWIPAT